MPSLSSSSSIKSGEIKKKQKKNSPHNYFPSDISVGIITSESCHSQWLDSH